MGLQEGDRYRCTDPACGCEIEVVKGPEPDGGGDLPPRCCCGAEMQEVTQEAVPVGPE